MKSVKKIFHHPELAKDYSFENILGVLIHSPSLQIFKKRLDTVLLNENKKREKFYDTMSEEKKMEFINGEIIVHSPVKIEHARSSENLFLLFKTFTRLHDLGQVCHEKILITLTRNDYEPDICFFKKEKSTKFQQGQMKFPAPDLIVEVLSPSTEKNDRELKFIDYAAHGIGEYWIIDPNKKSVEQYLLKKENYDRKMKAKSGLMSSRAIPGFKIPIKSIFDDKLNLKTLQKILK